jgi:glucose-6-phosphate 1-dehydrogenase
MTAEAGPHVLVIFGATGDLARRKLFPGLFQLARLDLLPDGFAVIGSGRHSPGGDEKFRASIADSVREFVDDFDEAAWQEFAARIFFQRAVSDDGAELAAAVRSTRRQLGRDARTLLYLSVPPAAMADMVGMLGASGLADGARLIMEKPFGQDLDSARELDAAVHEVFDEERVFRIDHFLGKEAVQNLLALRAANDLFASVWDRGHVRYVRIDVPERIGIEGRASFMEATGTFRDMVPTHLFQVLGMVALEPPAELSERSLREARLAVFRALRPLDPGDVVFGQYEGYRDEDGVADDSGRETYVALKAWVDNPRWRGVPFHLRTGKALASDDATVTLGLSEPPAALPGEPDGPDGLAELVVELADPFAVRVDVRVRRPGPGMDLTGATLALRGEGTPLEPYARLVYDALRGDRLLYTSAAEIERLWEVCAPVLADPPPARPYARGSDGP